jgi:hypothetical protein
MSHAGRGSPLRTGNGTVVAFNASNYLHVRDKVPDPKNI